jgi:hypothetical protein
MCLLKSHSFEGDKKNLRKYLAARFLTRETNLIFNKRNPVLFLF